MQSGDPAVPPVLGLYDGAEIRFLHTEASDPDVAQMLADMMASPVIHVPNLADVPDTALAEVYVFTNGVRPAAMNEHGPFGYQADVLDSVPGHPAYSPLRAVNVVTWHDDTEPRELRSITELDAAQAADQMEIGRPGIVVNMPIIDWPGGR